eukprot:Nitzschia sp. Nitz4//scaffold353_size16344//5748//6785//NITZ4_008861-RA/size16344-processed-gene-0.8-mRNA-1//-1//CDS//3329548913//7847//frame0
METSSSLSWIESEPLTTLSMAGTSVWTYIGTYAGLLVCWLLYLVLPRGFRKLYCASHRKRYAKRADPSMPSAGYWLPANRSMTIREDGSTVSMPRSGVPSSDAMSDFHGAAAGNLPGRARAGGVDTSMSTPQQDMRLGGGMRPPGGSPPSPRHPALSKIPPPTILNETMDRIKGRGIRLIAHGVHCDPKRVWIGWDAETQTVTWQTEFPRRIPNGDSHDLVLMRGSVHRIPMTHVLYIDVGKKTNALKGAANLSDSTCFSLLTQNGSLDLQAHSKLERDSLVGCFCIILDEVHRGEDWRALYEASPDPSLVGTPQPSQVGVGGGGGGAGNGGGTLPNPSDWLVDV